MCKFFQNTLDTLIYALIGPFAALYVFPQFFRDLESKCISLPKAPLLIDLSGTILMWLGAGVAIWCGLLMALNKWGTVVPFFKPTALIISGPYSLVRHPMMWTLILVLIGETLVFLSPATLLWLIIWVRFSFILITRYEEPFLRNHFGKEYEAYSERVPRWIPFTKPN